MESLARTSVIDSPPVAEASSVASESALTGYDSWMVSVSKPIGLPTAAAIAADSGTGGRGP